MDPPAADTPQPVLQVTDAARELVLQARSAEADAERLALYLEVNGADGNTYTYDMWFEAVADAGPRDAVQHHDDLAVVVVLESIDRIRGATLDVGDHGGQAGLVMVNPNTPPRSSLGLGAEPKGDLDNPLAYAVIEVLDQQVNPQIAMHGGRADLVAVDDEGVAYLRLSGGCQGCGLAQVTLSQGISVAIRDGVPGITDIVDVTAHAEGANPYFEGAKK